VRRLRVNASGLVQRVLKLAERALPKSLKSAAYRRLVDCEAAPGLILKIAETREELEACFKLLHDSYVASGFMKRDPSGLRATIYHALPTTTTLCAKVGNTVVGTLSLIRQSELGFPLESAFDLSEVRALGGNIAEASAFAIHRTYRKAGAKVLFPLMKFMYDYCNTFFDVRHLVIAVNPRHIGMYESMLLFKRLSQVTVSSYDFANGAQAVGAFLDLKAAPEEFKAAYEGRSRRRNLYQYFIHSRLKGAQMPNRRYFTTNDPVMTPELLDYFFNTRTQGFANLSPSRAGLMHSIYNLEEYRRILPQHFSHTQMDNPASEHQRHSLKCPARLFVGDDTFEMQVIEILDGGFIARTRTTIPLEQWGSAHIELGEDEGSRLRCMAASGQFRQTQGVYEFAVSLPDVAWQKFIAVLKFGSTHSDMDNATQFLLV
jgi:hypothetical protein